MTVNEAVHEALDRFFNAPTSEPLIIEKAGDTVILSRGIPKTRMTISAAAEYLGMDRKTLSNKYIKRGWLRVGADRKIARKSVVRLFNSLDSRD